jgi:hypothetical protein
MSHFVFLETFAVQLLISQMENRQFEVMQNEKQVYVPIHQNAQRKRGETQTINSTLHVLKRT